MGSEPVMNEMIFISPPHHGQVSETSKASRNNFPKLFLHREDIFSSERTATSSLHIWPGEKLQYFLDWGARISRCGLEPR